MAINLAAFGSLKSNGNPNGESALCEGLPYLDNVIAHEMTHAVMKAVVNNFDSLPQFITEGKADLTIGNDHRKNYIEDLVSGKKSLMLLRWLAKQASDSDNGVINNTTNNTSITTTDADKIIKNSGANVLFKYESGNDIITGFRADSTLSICGSSYSTKESG